MSVTRLLPVVCAAYVLALPSSLQAQGREMVLQGVVDVSNAVAGTRGDEGPVLASAVAALEAGLRQWDGVIATVEAAFSSEIGTARPAAAARMRAALGTVYLERGRLEEALSQFDAALTLAPELTEVHLLRGLAHTLRGHPGDAAVAYGSLWEGRAESPAHAYLFLQAGPEAHQRPGASGAMAALLKAVEQVGSSDGGPLLPSPSVVDDSAVTAPVLPPAAYAGAAAHLAARQYDAAVARLRAAIASDPLVHADAMQDLDMRTALAAARRGDPQALAVLEEAASRHQSGELHRVIGIVYAEAGQNDSSLEPFRRAARLDPANERARLGLADALVASGDLAAARDVLGGTAAAMPDSGLARWKLGRLLQRMGDERGALRSFEEAASLPALAGAAHLHAAIGRLHHNALDLDAAAAAYARRVALAPNDAAAHYDLGEIYRAQGWLRGAMTEYLVAALLDPRRAGTFAAIGQVHAAEGRDEAAVVMLGRATGLDGSHIEARYALGRALLRLGRVDEAQRELAIYGQLQEAAMEEERKRFRDNQTTIEETLGAGAPAGTAR